MIHIKKVFDIFGLAIDNSNSIFIYFECTILHVIKECKFKCLFRCSHIFVWAIVSRQMEGYFIIVSSFSVDVISIRISNRLMWLRSCWRFVSDSIREGFIPIATRFISIIIEAVVIRGYKLDSRCFKSFTFIFGRKFVGLSCIIIVNGPTFSLIFSFVGFDVWNFSKFEWITCCHGITNFCIGKDVSIIQNIGMFIILRNHLTINIFTVTIENCFSNSWLIIHTVVMVAYRWNFWFNRFINLFNCS